MTSVFRMPGSGTKNNAFFPRRFLIVAGDSQGASTVFLENVPPGAGPPLHVHHREQETFYVLSGALRFHCEGRDEILEAGGLALIPAGAKHTFKNEGDSEAEALITLTPGGGEGFFKAVEAEGLNPADDMPRIAEIAAEYGLEFVGPPL